MAQRKATAAAEKPKVPSCDNHPDREATHTTDSNLHHPISLCSACLQRAPHLSER